ncbi:hypothetical protein Ddye_021217 [Dipteronia dyeriana]|uniref:DUF1985 domain-containing protein n=1 Tax=Dipteronia dyeriana TaxID=168575 RepID=A0AAD9WXH6_9ROSI|nr:hypothetical protein Ddye_021217 [Dipteronia dyeriana]
MRRLLIFGEDKGRRISSVISGEEEDRYFISAEDEEPLKAKSNICFPFKTKLSLEIDKDMFLDPKFDLNMFGFYATYSCFTFLLCYKLGLMVSIEEEDLDQYLVYPRDTWSYNITINTHCKHKFIRQIESVLESCGELDKFRSSCFGHYLDLPAGGYFQAQYMHNLFLRQIIPPGACMNEMWFALGKTKVRLGIREFCLCTGLKFGELTDIFSRVYEPVTDGIHFRYFGGSRLLADEVIDLFLAKSFQHKGDALKMTLVLFVNYILFGVDERTQVSYWLMTLAEDTNGFNMFAWGYFVFKMTLYYIHQGFRMPDPTSPTCRYNLSGFVWGVQFWAMEAIPVMRHKLGHYLGSGYPRFRKFDFITKVLKMRETRLEMELEGKQHDGTSCGIFMIQGIKNIMRNKNHQWNWNKDTVPGLRKDMAFEIFGCSIEED